MYSVKAFNPETGEFEKIFETNYSVRVLSDQYGEKVVFETDDPEYSGD